MTRKTKEKECKPCKKIAIELHPTTCDDCQLSNKKCPIDHDIIKCKTKSYFKPTTEYIESKLTDFFINLGKEINEFMNQEKALVLKNKKTGHIGEYIVLNMIEENVVKLQEITDTNTVYPMIWYTIDDYDNTFELIGKVQLKHTASDENVGQ